MNLTPLAIKLAAVSASLTLIPGDTIYINGFEVKIEPKINARVEAIFVMSDIKLLVEKINNKHCQ